MKKLILLLPIFLYAQVIDTVIRLPDRPENILYIQEGNELYINFCIPHYIIVLDCSTYQVKKLVQIPTSSLPAAYGTWNWRRNKIYFTFNPRPESIAVIDNQTDSIIKWIAIGTLGTPCYNSKDDKVYAPDGSSLAVIDCATDSIIKIIPPQPYYISDFTIWDSIGNKVYCGGGVHDKVTVIDCSTDSIIKTISTGLGSPYGAVYNSEQRKLYVGGWSGRGCAVIDAVRDSMIKFYNIWFYQDIPIIWNNVEDKIYWPGEDSLYIIDCQNDSIIKDYNYIISNIGFASWSNHLYITRDTWIDDYEGFLRIFNCHNDSLIANLWIGAGVSGVTANPQDQKIYIASSYDSSIYVIRDEAPGIEENPKLQEAIPISQKSRISTYPDKIVVHYSTNTPSRVRIQVYNLLGERVKTLISEKVEKGEHQVVWDKTDNSFRKIPYGIYFIAIDKENKPERVKVIIR